MSDHFAAQLPTPLETLLVLRRSGLLTRAMLAGVMATEVQHLDNDQLAEVVAALNAGSPRDWITAFLADGKPKES